MMAARFIGCSFLKAMHHILNLTFRHANVPGSSLMSCSTQQTNGSAWGLTGPNAPRWWGPVMLLAIVLLAVLMPPSAQGQFGRGLQIQAEQLYEDGLARLQANELEMAELNFKAALRLLPNDPTLIRYVQLVQERISKSPGYLMRLRLQRTLIPEVDLREMNLTQIVAFLRTASEGRSPDGKPVNILFDWPADRPQPLITLSMRRVNLFTIVEYLAELGPLMYRTDEVTLFLTAAPEHEPVPEEFDPFTALSSPIFKPADGPPAGDLLGPPPVLTDPFAQGQTPGGLGEGGVGLPERPQKTDEELTTEMEEDLALQQEEEDPDDLPRPELPEPPPDAPPTEVVGFHPRYTALLKSTLLPTVRLKDAHFSDVLRFVTKSADLSLASRGGSAPLPTGVNFVSATAFLPETPRITVTLDNVPVLDLLVYLAESAQMEMRVDENAVVFLPNQGRAAPKDLSRVLLREYPVTNRRQLVRRLQETFLDSISIFPGDVMEVLQGIRDRLEREGKPAFNIHSHLAEAQPMLLSPLVMDRVSVLHVLGYIAENSGCTFRIDPNVVVFLPSAAPTPKPVIENLTDRNDEERTRLLQSRLRSFIVEEASYPNVPLTGVLQMLKMELDDARKPTDPPFNIVLELDPMGTVPMVNLELRQVPALRLLDYIATQTGTTVRIDPYAIVFVQRPEFVPEASPSTFGL